MNRIRKLSHSEISKHRIPPERVQTAERLPVYALLDNIRSMYNVGSIFRSSDGAFLRKIFLTGYTPTPEKQEVRKTALGAVDAIPWEYTANPIPLLEQLRNSNVSVIVLEQTTESIPYYELPKDIFPACLVVGNEITGISPPILETSNFVVEIPMFGTKQSLNVAVAYGIVLFHILRLYHSR